MAITAAVTTVTGCWTTARLAKVSPERPKSNRWQTNDVFDDTRSRCHRTLLLVKAPHYLDYTVLLHNSTSNKM